MNCLQASIFEEYRESRYTAVNSDTIDLSGIEAAIPYTAALPPPTINLAVDTGTNAIDIYERKVVYISQKT